MSELTQTLKLLVSRYPGTMAELARRASIDRSTLYKILSGQRTPKELQLEHLADALELHEDQKSALLLQYKQRSRSTDPKLGAELHNLLETAFRVDDYVQSASGTVSNEVAATLHATSGFAEGTRSVTDCLSALIAEYLLSGDTRPLLLSPYTNPVLDRALVERFSVLQGAPVPVCQLLVFSQGADQPSYSVGDISTLTRTLQFLFLSKMHYEARVVRSAATQPGPGMLVPVYLLFPEKALLMDESGQRVLVITDPDAVQSMRLEFTRTYLAGSSVLKLATESHSFTESMAMYTQLTAQKTHLCMLRHQPFLTIYLTEDIVRRFLSPAPEMQAQLPALVGCLGEWCQQKPDVYFSEDGLMYFVRTGRINDLPPDLYEPLDPAARREILLRMRADAASSRQTLRIVDLNRLALTPTMSVNIYRGIGVIFCQGILEPGGVYSREYLLQEPTLTEALLTYLDENKTTDRVRSQKYTLDFIDYCLRLL